MYLSSFLSSFCLISLTWFTWEWEEIFLKLWQNLKVCKKNIFLSLPRDMILRKSEIQFDPFFVTNWKEMTDIGNPYDVLDANGLKDTVLYTPAYLQHPGMNQSQLHCSWLCICPCSCTLASWWSVDGLSTHCSHPQEPQSCIVSPWRSPLLSSTTLLSGLPCWRWQWRPPPCPAAPW